MILLQGGAMAHEQGQHGSRHDPGTAQLMLSLTGETLSVQLSAPLANFLKADGSLPSIGQPESGFSFVDLIGLPDAAVCTFISENIEESPYDSTVGHTENASDIPTEAGSDILIRLAVSCTEPANLDRIALNMFSTYTGFDSVKTAFMANGKVSAKKLTSETPQIERP